MKSPTHIFCAIMTRIGLWLSAAGITFRKPFLFIVKLPRFFIEFWQFSHQKSEQEKIPIHHLCPCVFDKGQASAAITSPYFLQDLIVAREIFKNNPKRHVDIGSRIDGFVTHVASFRAIEVLDIRPLDITIPNVTFTTCDLMRQKANVTIQADSVSCLHVLEHFGLGRYGDPLDAEGWLHGLKNIESLVLPGGKFYLSVPVGKEGVIYNAHRIFNPQTICSALHPSFKLERFEYIDPKGTLCDEAEAAKILEGKNLDKSCGCGIFFLVRKKKVKKTQ